MSYVYEWEYIHNYVFLALHRATGMEHTDVFWNVVMHVALSTGR